MKLFILSNIGENIFTSKPEIERLLSAFGFSFLGVQLGVIGGLFGEISETDFRVLLPVLNGKVGKNFFYSSINTGVSEVLILGKNVFDFELDEKKMKQNALAVGEIQSMLNSPTLLTNSLKKEMSEILLGSIYDMGGFLIKTYFLMSELIDSREGLEKIISDPEGLAQYQMQALLLEKTSLDKLDTIKARFDSLNVELTYYAQILHKYFITYIQ